MLADRTAELRDNDTIFFFAEDPAAANIVNALTHCVAGHGYRAEICATGAAVPILDAAGHKIVCLTIGRERDILSAVRACIAMIGTSSNVQTSGLKFIDESKSMNIPTVGIVDAFRNASVRFRGIEESPFAHRPDWLLVPDRNTRAECGRLGFELDRIAVLGNPQYEHAVGSIRSARSRLQKALALPKRRLDQKVLTFMSEPPTKIAEDYGEAENFSGWGDTKLRTHVALQEILSALESQRDEVFFILRLHPNDDPQEYERYAGLVDYTSQTDSVLDLIAESSVVTGMISSAVCEAAFSGIPTISIISAKRECNFLPDEVKSRVMMATNRDELRRWLNRAVSGRLNELEEPSTYCWDRDGFLQLVAGLCQRSQMAASQSLSEI
jgi:hypothetical protein